MAAARDYRADGRRRRGRGRGSRGARVAAARALRRRRGRAARRGVRCRRARSCARRSRCPRRSRRICGRRWPTISTGTRRSSPRSCISTPSIVDARRRRRRRSASTGRPRAARSSTRRCAMPTAWGASVVAVVARAAGALRRDSRAQPAADATRARRAARVAALAVLGARCALLAVLRVAAVAMPLWQKRDYVIALSALDRPGARAGGGVGGAAHANSSSARADYNFALEREIRVSERVAGARRRDASCCPTTPGSRSSR